MSVETTSETTEQQVSTVEEDSLKQPEPDLLDIELPDDDPNKPTPSTSKNVLSNGLKRPLPDVVDGEKKKKLRLTEVSKLKADYDKLGVTNKDDSGKNLLNKSSSSDTLAITEISDHENVSVVNDIQVTENISTAVNDSTVRESNSNLSNTKICTIENIVNSKTNYAEPLLEFKNKIHLTKNTDETTSIESPCNSNTNNSKKVDVCSNGIDQEFGVIDSDDIILGVKKVSKESFPQLLKLFSRKELTYDQFDSMCTQKCIALMTSSKYFGKYYSELQSFKKREKIWRSKYTSLFRKIKEMEPIVNAYKQQLQSNEYASPHKITGTVGLPAVACPKKKGSIKLPKQAIPMPKPDPVSISVEDDDDVVILEFEKEVTASSSTSKITNTTSKKHSTSKTLVVSPKNVTASPKTFTAAKALNPINIGTSIDLTEDDDVIEESNIIDLEDSISPIKIPRRIPALILPGETLSGNSGKTITYLELSKNPSSSSSSYITGTASRSPQRTIVLNKDIINTSPKSKNLKPVLTEVSRVDPILVQPCTVTYTAHRVPESGKLQPMSTASYTPRTITVSQLSTLLKTLTPSYTTCQIPASRISGLMPGIALPQESLGTSYTTCRVPISLPALHHTGSQSIRKPPPPAIPLFGHPSPVPGIPNQKSHSSWKRLPPAPNLTIYKSSEVENIPQGTLVLSWTLNVNTTIADVMSYEIYSYQEIPDQSPNIELWKKIGKVDALALPMVCSLTHLSNGQKYHFLVRAVDVYTRVGPFSKPESILFEDF